MPYVYHALYRDVRPLLVAFGAQNFTAYASRRQASIVHCYDEP